MELMGALTNTKQFDKLPDLVGERGDGDMFTEIFDEIEDRGIQKGIEQGILSSIRNLMKSTKLTTKQAMDALLIPEDEQESYAKKIMTDEQELIIQKPFQHKTLEERAMECGNHLVSHEKEMNWGEPVGREVW